MTETETTAQKYAPQNSSNLIVDHSTEITQFTNAQGEEQWRLLLYTFQGQQANKNAFVTPSGPHPNWQAGYFISVPENFIYSNPKPQFEIWHSPSFDQLLTIEWEQHSSSSQIARVEAASTVAFTKSNFSISHPIIAGAASTTLIESPAYPNSPSAVYLWAIGRSNDVIYHVSAIAQTPDALRSIRSLIKSFSLQ